MVMVLLATVCAEPALGATTSSDVRAQPFATGFSPSSSGIGPVGLAFDTDGNLVVADRSDLYRFGPEGGSADAAHRINALPVGGMLTGLAFGADGRLYAARWISGTTGDVVELDPNAGTVVRVLATGLPCPMGLAVDPYSGDLFVSTVYCAAGVLRISGGQASPYVTGVNVDGLAFGPDGALYLVHERDANGYTVSSVPGTAASSHDARTPLAKLPDPDGVAIAETDATTGRPPFLVANRRDGVISRIDLSLPGHPSRNLLVGGSRGDFVVVGDDGCLYATQSDSVLKLTNADGSCRAGGRGIGGLVPTRPPLVPAPATFVQLRGGSSKAGTCRTNRRLHVRFRAPRGVRVTRARLYIGSRRARTVSGRALRRSITLTRLPKRAFTLTIRARTTKGRSIVVRRRYKACAGVIARAEKKTKKRARR